MNRRLARIAKWVGYPLFYLTCLLLFIYATFPFDQLRDRIVAEFDKQQAKAKRRPGEQPMKLQIDELDGYWVTGVELTGVRLLIPPKIAMPGAKKKAGGFPGFSGGDKDEKKEPPKATELLIDHATARVQLLSLLTGNVKIDFEADAFGGTIEGTLPAAGDSDVDVKFDAVQLGRIAPLADLLEGIPVFGLASGKVQLTPREKKFSKADGRIEIQIAGLKLGKKIKNEDGKVEDVVSIQGMSVPSVQAGTLVIQGDVANGLFTFSEFTGRGRDFEVLGEGKLKLSDVWDRSTIDAFIKFKFTDEYRGSSDATIALLGKPGASGRPLVEMPGSPLGRAKAEEGFYRFQLKGPLGRLKPRPAGTPGGNKRKTRASSRGKLPRARPSLNKRPSRLVDRRKKPEEREEGAEEEEERRSGPTLRNPRGAKPAQRLRRPGTTEEQEPREDGEPGREAEAEAEAETEAEAEASGTAEEDPTGADGAADDGTER